jgi:hypothetical protein
MDIFFDKYGFESDNFDAVTKALSQVLKLTAEVKFNDSYGGDISSFGKRDAMGGRLVLYHNHTADITGPIVHEDDFPELGLILRIEQRDKHIETKLRRMEGFKPILLYRSQRLESKGKSEVLFDSAKERAKRKP